jgi:hypothetical protein
VRFSCDQCGRSYVASDEVAGRAFRMRCKGCGSEVVVRPPRSAPAPFSSAPKDAAPARASSPAGGGDVSRRPSFDPFEGDELPEGDIAVSDESLEILERTPQPRPIPRPPPPTPPRTPPRASPPPRAEPPASRGRPGRMLPAEDEAMLGPPGSEGRRSVPRWVVIALAVGALAAAGGLAFLR